MLDILSPAIQNNINQETINLMSDRVSTYNAKIYLWSDYFVFNILSFGFQIIIDY